MTRKYRLTRWIVGVAILAAAECVGVAAIGVVSVQPAQAQDGFPFLSRQRPSRGGGFFQQLFGTSKREVEREQAPADYSRAPSARKPDAKAEPVAPTTSIVVLGDGMADWLAHGLEDAFADAPEIAIIRRSKANSGLLRYDSRSDLDWWHAARDILAQETPNYVVMMMGVSDRQNIREKDIAKEADKADADKKNGAAQSDIIAPEPPSAKKANGVVEFRSDAWEKVYSRRIDETVAALKSKGVPVFWVGLPSIRGTRSTADVVYLNDLYRARVQRAGAVYIDVWDGFVDEGGKYTSFGPDYEGQMRRLRSGDGVYFTKYGSRKLAHYVEREVRRYMSNRGPIALPFGPMGPVPADGQSVARPLAGPVVPLTAITANSDELLGASGAASARADAIASGVLVKGDSVSAPTGRADNFLWPRGGDAAQAAAANASAPAAVSAAGASKPAAAPGAKSAAKPGSVQPATAMVRPNQSIIKPEPGAVQPKSEPAAKAESKPQVRLEVKPVPQQAVAKPKPAKPPETKPQPQQAAAPRPPQPVRRSSDGLFGANGPFGWMR